MPPTFRRVTVGFLTLTAGFLTLTAGFLTLTAGFLTLTVGFHRLPPGSFGVPGRAPVRPPDISARLARPSPSCPPATGLLGYITGGRVHRFVIAHPEPTELYTSGVARLEDLLTRGEVLAVQQRNGRGVVRESVEQRDALRENIRKEPLRHLARIAQAA